MTIETPATERDPAAVNRGPYVSRIGAPTQEEGRPSDALAANVRAYRVLRRVTQDDLAARMTDLGHGWGRSTVSAVEGRGRNVSVDELFGLAASFGVSIGQLLDPTGPDHSRRLSFSVGVTDRGDPRSVAPGLAQLWGASRAVVRVGHDGQEFALDVADELPVEAQRNLDGLRSKEPRSEH
ncbi:MAG TPA: helix-turn-helix transcriptional regulator [Aeromicrobium sp.]|nr:helix-turn-helix transcriptional regulator [Aeromicrobium sp.]